MKQFLCLRNAARSSSAKHNNTDKNNKKKEFQKVSISSREWAPEGDKAKRDRGMGNGFIGVSIDTSLL